MGCGRRSQHAGGCQAVERSHEPKNAGTDFEAVQIRATRHLERAKLDAALDEAAKAFNAWKADNKAARQK